MVEMKVEMLIQSKGVLIFQNSPSHVFLLGSADSFLVTQFLTSLHILYSLDILDLGLNLKLSLT